MHWMSGDRGTEGQIHRLPNRPVKFFSPYFDRNSIVDVLKVYNLVVGTTGSFVPADTDKPASIGRIER